MNNNYWDILPNEIQIKIKQISAAQIIQSYMIKRFYKIYGYTWKERIRDYQYLFDYFCYLYEIVDPSEDYINYYRHNDITYLCL